MRAALAARTEELFRASGAFREGHFRLKSGRHGDAYVEKFAVLSDPAATSELRGFWAALVRDADGPPPLARPRRGPDDRRRASWPSRPPASSGSGRLFAEEVDEADGGTHREFRRGFTIEPGERVLLSTTS